MKTLVPVKTSKSAVRFVSSVIKVRKNSLHVLSHVRVYANGHLQMTATDLDVTTSAICPAQSERDGVKLIPASALKDATSGKADFEIESEDNAVTIRANGNTRSVPGLDVADFPQVPTPPENAPSYTLPADAFFRALEGVKAAQSIDPMRHVLHGVLFDLGADAARLVATDGRRLHVVELPGLAADAGTMAKIASFEAARIQAHAALDAAHNELADTEKSAPPVYSKAENIPGNETRQLYERIAHESVTLAESRVRACKHAAGKADEDLQSAKSAAQFIIPSKAVKAILAMPADRTPENSVTLTTWNGFARVTCGSFSVTAKLIDDNYPNWRQVFPHEYAASSEINISDFSKAIASVRGVCTEKSNSVKLHFTKHELTVTAASEERGEAKARVAIAYDDKEKIMAFNPDYLADAMESAKQFGPRVFAGLIDEFSPIVFQNGENWKCIIMPMPMS